VIFREHLAIGLSLTLYLLLMLLTALPPAFAQGPKKALRQDQLLGLLSHGVYSSRVAMLVRERGIAFVPTSDYLEKLRQAGADQTLLHAVTTARIQPTDQGSGLASSIPVKPQSSVQRRAASAVRQPPHATAEVLRSTALPAKKTTIQQLSKVHKLQTHVSGADGETLHAHIRRMEQGSRLVSSIPAKTQAPVEQRAASPIRHPSHAERKLLQAYQDLVSADSPQTIPPGTRINMRNWHRYKDFMPVGLQHLWEQKFFLETAT
jgi:hypothetical protein